MKSLRSLEPDLVDAENFRIQSKSPEPFSPSIESQVVNAALSRCSECGLPLRGPRRSKQPSKAESTNSAFINLRINKQRISQCLAVEHSPARTPLCLRCVGKYIVRNTCEKCLTADSLDSLASVDITRDKGASFRLSAISNQQSVAPKVETTTFPAES